MPPPVEHLRLLLQSLRPRGRIDFVSAAKARRQRRLDGRSSSLLSVKSDKVVMAAVTARAPLTSDVFFSHHHNLKKIEISVMKSEEW